MQAASNPTLAQRILGGDFDSATFPAQMVALSELNKQAAAAKRKAIAAEKAKAKRERPKKEGEMRTYMRHILYGQYSAVYNSCLTRKQVWALKEPELTRIYNQIMKRIKPATT